MMRGMGKTEKAKYARESLLRLWGYLSQEKRAISITISTVLTTTLLSLAMPYLQTIGFDRYLKNRDLKGLGFVCLVMLAIAIFSSLFSWLQSYVTAGASQRVISKIRTDLFKKLQSLPLHFFDKNSQGDLMSRLTNDIENINSVLSESVASLVSGAITLVGVAIAMLILNWKLALVSMAVLVGTSVWLNRWVVKRTRDAFRSQQASLGALNGLIEETLSAQRLVKACHREESAIQTVEDAATKLRNAATKAQTLTSVIGPMMNFMGNLSMASIAGYGGFLALHHEATVGTLSGFILYMWMFRRPLNEIATLYNSIQSAIAGAERVFQTIDETPEVDTGALGADKPMAGEVIFEGVDFSYLAGTPVLQGIDLIAKPGQVVALIGPTGAGKTTIINLLTRFYEIDSGRILIDGIDLREISKDTLRTQQGVVLQDAFLFSGTVRENIRYGRLNATDAEVEAAAQLANADGFIAHLPNEYETVLTERGGNLSQGQRQLLTIARAVIADPRILILDEATSSIDTRTEKMIQEAMRRLMQGRTSFVIAHRLSTIRDADQILVIDQGRILERGTHESLIEQDGFYAQLYARQFDANADTE